MTKIEVKKTLGYKLQINKKYSNIILSTLLLLPSDTLKFVTTRCWFVGSMDDSWALTLQAGDITQGQYLIFLSDELLQQPIPDIEYTILHEIGHVVLGHRNAVSKPQSKIEIRYQESEADRFANLLLQNRNE